MSPPRVRRLRALILHRTPAREKDRIVEVFSREEGKLRLLAAGVRRFPSRRAGHLEPLLESEILVSSSSRGDSIRDARVIRAFPRLRQDLPRVQTAYVIARLLREATAERLADPSLYDGVLALFGALESVGSLDPALVLHAAEVQVLRHLGLLPNLNACVRCQRPLPPHGFLFERATGGFLCKTCAPGRAVPRALTDVVKLLRLFVEGPVLPERLIVPEAVRHAAGELLQALFQAQTVRQQLDHRVKT